jgi:hypothetical protein
MHEHDQHPPLTFHETLTPPADERARELRTNIDRLLKQIAANNAAGYRHLARQFALPKEAQRPESEGER